MKIYSLNLNPKSNCGFSEMSNTIVKSIKGVGIENNVNLCFFNGNHRNVVEEMGVGGCDTVLSRRKADKPVISMKLIQISLEIGGFAKNITHSTFGITLY